MNEHYLKGSLFVVLLPRMSTFSPHGGSFPTPNSCGAASVAACRQYADGRVPGRLISVIARMAKGQC
jgi:hypothetical protein